MKTSLEQRRAKALTELAEVARLEAEIAALEPAPRLARELHDLRIGSHSAYHCPFCDRGATDRDTRENYHAAVEQAQQMLDLVGGNRELVLALAPLLAPGVYGGDDLPFE